MGSSSLEGISRLRSGVRSRRFSSYNLTGGNRDRWTIEAGATVTLAEITGAGSIRHIWMTTGEADNWLKGLVLRIYWNNEETPSVLCPVGDFFGLGHGHGAYVNAAPIQTFYLGMNSFFPMPFESAARITVTNEMAQDAILYFYVDYEEWDSYPGELGLFHAHFRHELVRKLPAEEGDDSTGTVRRLNTTGANNYVLLETEGRGHYVGCMLNLDTDEPGWWGEGDDMIFIDDEPWPPRLHGTGTEDYFCGAWNYNRLDRTFCAPQFGYHFKGNADYTGKHSQYRFHIEDPIYFNESIRVTIEHGHANDKQGYWSNTAYWYQVDRRTPLDSIGTFDERLPYTHGGLERWPGRSRSELPR
jgi:hypothetical protein